MDDPLRQLRNPVASGHGAALALRLVGMTVGTALLAMGSVGCRSNPVDQAYVQTLHSEIRMLEDEIFAIESEYEKNLALLEACENRSEVSSGSSAIRGSSSNPLRSLPSILEPKRAGREAPEPELLPPSIDSGQPSSSRSIPNGSLSRPTPSPLRSNSSNSQPPMLEAPNIDFGEPDASFGDIEQQSYDEAVDLPTEARVTHIVLNPRLTGGLDFNGAPGDDGLNVVVEPRNQDDVFVPLAGTLSLVLLDPRLEGEVARVARWDLPPDEVQRRIKTDEETAPGIHLKLPWNALPPSHEDLLLFVRYETPDGRQVEAQAALTLAVSGKSSTRWTPRSPESIGGGPSREHAVPPNLSAGDIPRPASVPTVADLRRNESDPRWSAPKQTIAPVGAESPVGPVAPPKANLKPPEWKPYR